MSTNKNLTKSFNAKNDEYYTTMEEIVRECKHYNFEGLNVYCNCDTEQSNFWKYFYNNFEKLKLKSITATSIEGIKLFSSDGHTIQKVPLSSGDYKARIDELVKCDVVVTNPPFSKIKEFIPFLMKYNKRFLIIAGKMCVKYSDVYPFFEREQIWGGYNESKCSIKFESDNELKSVPSFWVTNLNCTADKFVPTAKFEDYSHPELDNYSAVEVSALKEIPYDYNGVMAVPITYLIVHNPKLFRIVGRTQRDPNYLRTKIYSEKDTPRWNDFNVTAIVRDDTSFDGFRMLFSRVFIQKRV